MKSFKDESAVKRRPKSDPKSNSKSNPKLPEEEEKIEEMFPLMNHSVIVQPISQPSLMLDNDKESNSLEKSNESSNNVNNLS